MLFQYSKHCCFEDTFTYSNLRHKIKIYNDISKIPLVGCSQRAAVCSKCVQQTNKEAEESCSVNRFLGAPRPCRWPFISSVVEIPYSISFKINIKIIDGKV